MPQTRPPTPSPDRYDDSPIAWFGELLLAADRGDYQRASVAQERLDRLGWHVRRKTRQSHPRKEVTP
jgi:hypothetical protein